MVSHDRRFLDHVITSTLSFGEDGRVIELVGGYDDWKRQTQAMATQDLAVSRAETPASRGAGTQGDSKGEVDPAGADRTPSSGLERPRVRKLTFNEQRELDGLPARIEALDAELARLTAELNAPDFYTRGAAAIGEAMQRVEAIPMELEAAYARWEVLEQLRVATSRRA